VAPLAGHPRLVAVGGGYPILENGQCVGGLGISGGSHEQDQQAAEEALAALGFELPGHCPPTARPLIGHCPVTYRPPRRRSARRSPEQPG
jgi:hypothetical protein